MTSYDIRLFFIISLLALPATALAAETKRIEDNSFLIEEAYNQEEGVIQYIQSYQYSKKTKEWLYAFTHEIPLPDQTHQISYSVPLSRVLDESFQSGLGDIAINYRYQLIDTDGIAIAPRFSVILPTGNYRKKLGYGVTGYQVNIPLSIDLGEKWVSHWNAGATYTPKAYGTSGARADALGDNYGVSIVYLYSETLNFLVDVVRMGAQSVQPDSSKLWEKMSFVNPGFRYAKNYASGLQVVSGISIPIGIGPAKGDNGIMLYLSFEQ